MKSLKKTTLWLTAFISLSMLSGCTFWAAHYNATRQENLTKLKAAHIGFINEWSAGSGNIWNKDGVMASCKQVDLLFKQAFEFAEFKSGHDKTAQRAVNILWDEFKQDCKLALRRKELFSTAFRDELLLEVETNYHYAIAGELSRVH